MPIYEYECNENGHRFEKWQSMQDEPIKTCTICGSPVHKVLHPAGLIFKGSGWYITDNRKSTGSSNSTGSTASSESSSSAQSSKSESETKSDGKSEKTSSSDSSSTRRETNASKSE